jgi:hypothetical protein
MYDNPNYRKMLREAHGRLIEAPEIPDPEPEEFDEGSKMRASTSYPADLGEDDDDAKSMAPTPTAEAISELHHVVKRLENDIEVLQRNLSAFLPQSFMPTSFNAIGDGAAEMEKSDGKKSATIVNLEALRRRLESAVSVLGSTSNSVLR